VSLVLAGGDVERIVGQAFASLAFRSEGNRGRLAGWPAWLEVRAGPSTYVFDRLRSAQCRESLVSRCGALGHEHAEVWDGREMLHRGVVAEAAVDAECAEVGQGW
jgi:hypothetical protein